MKLTSIGITVLSALIFATIALAEEHSAPTISTSDSTATDVCEAFSDKAAEAKLARHRQELLAAKANIEEQLIKLDQKTKELEALISKRDQMRSLVSESLIKMYSNVESEVAAQQLQKLNPQMAAEILQRLNPKQSGEIVTAMETDFASKVVKNLLAETSKQKPKSETQ